VIYRRRASPLHTARAAAGCAYCAALALAALMQSNPIVLGAVTLSIVLAGVAAGVGPQLLRATRFALPIVVAIALINALVDRNGLTVIARLGNLPLLGQTDVTLEATVYGLILGLRAMALILCGTLYTVAVDPDEVLRLFRRISFRSALSATLATRLVPLLVRDGRRLADAQRCRPGRPPSRVTLMRAACSGVLDRALDTAAALEVRGYGARPSAGRGPTWRAAYSRHDVAFYAAATATVALAIATRAGGLAPFSAYPALQAPASGAVLGVAAATVVLALLPFADRRGLRT
jgi:energy-coupling factor transport system permease protein